MGSLVIVQWLKRLMVVSLVAVWALASNHCRLEFFDAFSFVACNDRQDCPGQPDKGCEADGCATVENQLYKAERAQTPIPEPALLLADFLIPLADESSRLPARPRVIPGAAPKVLSCLWQFSYRTALSPRAPSLLS